MAFNNSFTAVTGATYTAAQYNTYVRDNFSAIWVYTTAGDIVYASSATALSRLAIGGAGKQLGVSGGVPAWVDGVPGIFTTAGDLVYGSAADTAARLAIGAAGQKLGAAAGLPVWESLISRRQGGSATEWNTSGDTNYVPSNSILQVGRKSVSVTGNPAVGSAVVTYPVAFSYMPIILLTGSPTGYGIYEFGVFTQSASAFTIYAAYTGAATFLLDVFWLAIGPP